MQNGALLHKVRKFAIKNSKDDDLHGFPHVERVYEICVELGEKLNANLLVLKIAALLHDIGRIQEEIPSEKRNHAEISAEIASNFLEENGCNLSLPDLENILHSIRAHSFSNNVVPETLEAKILSDADKLDALGAIGLYRTIGFTIQKGGNLNKVIDHLENKILKLKDLMHLNITKRIAEERQQIVLDFYNKINEEK
ncbi:MAG: HD domain-containing protein [Promethearchaeota archaeon]|nr:MAG: HD domain-containing protein [Candidatus Lokiarchaeota archaeon]